MARARPTWKTLSRHRPQALLAPTQIRWLGALILAAQLAESPYVPLWIAGLGIMMVGVRFALVHRDRLRPGSAPARISRWSLALFAIAGAIAIRISFGYFLNLDPLVAFLYILAGIKFLEARSVRDGTFLICLSCLLAIAPFFHSQSPLAALAAAPVLVLIGTALQVTSRPRSLTGPGTVPAHTARASLALSGRMLLQGIPLAALLFALFPRLAGPLWSLPSDATARTGLTEHMAPGLISELTRSDAVAFRVDFEGPVPPSNLRYWRGPVLTQFDGTEWSVLPDRAQGFPARATHKAIAYTVSMEPTNKRWLFALDVAAALPSTPHQESADPQRVIARLTRDMQLLANGTVWQHVRYREESMLGSRHPFIADAAGERQRSESLALPTAGPNGNPRAAEFAAALRAAHPAPLDFINAVLTHFREESFFYTMVPGVRFESNAIDGFLFDSRRGFCEHYATAFVVLLRAAGIPARVITGYQGGEVNPRGGYLIVRESDAHAWAEALVDGEWRRFDPTAAVAPSRIEIGLGAAVPDSDPIPLFARVDGRWFKEMELAWDALNYGWRQNVVGFGFDRQRELWHNWQLDLFAPIWLFVITGGAAAAWASALLAWLIWRRRRSDRAGTLWNTACARLARAGLARMSHEGPLAYAARASVRWPEFGVALSVLGEAYAALRYGPGSTHADDDPRRAAAIARMERAIGILPAAARLRSIAG